MSELLEQVKQNPPNWAEDIIEVYPYASEGEIWEYATSYYWCQSASVNVHDVIGTAHPDYSGKSWLNLLHNGKRMQSINLPLLAENPGYYYETKKKEPEMQYRRIDDKTYICREGNHRTCIARFLFHYEGHSIIHGIATEEFTIDHGFKKAHELLNNVLMKNNMLGNTKVIRTTLSRDDTSGWMREHYDLKLEVNGRGDRLLLSTDEIHELILDSQRLFRKMFGKYKKYWKQ